MHLPARALLVGALVATSLAGCGGATHPTTATAAALTDIGAGLRGPAGLTAVAYAKGLEHVAALAVDDAGRVFASTAAYADDGTDAVYLLPSAGAAPLAVISGLHTPLGLLWYQDELYVASKERIDAYGGFDGTRFASERTVVTLPSGVGEVNGIAIGSDHRLVVGVSAPCDHCTPTLDESGAVLSVGTDGSDLHVLAKGLRAPVGLAYRPGTDDLYVTMDQRDDLGRATPGDWLGLVTAGQDWGFPDCYGQSTDTCSTHPVAELDAHAAVGGLAFVQATTADRVGRVLGDAALVAEWATAKVESVHLAAAGQGEAEVTTVLTGLKNPMPLLTEADGDLLVGDWGSGIVYEISVPAN